MKFSDARLSRAEAALRATSPRRLVYAHNPMGENGVPAHLFSCPEFDGRPHTCFSSIDDTRTPDCYHWTREELEAEAERRGVELWLLVFEYQDGAIHHDTKNEN